MSEEERDAEKGKTMSHPPKGAGDGAGAGAGAGAGGGAAAAAGGSSGGDAPDAAAKE